MGWDGMGWVKRRDSYPWLRLLPADPDGRGLGSMAWLLRRRRLSWIMEEDGAVDLGAQLEPGTCPRPYPRGLGGVARGSRESGRRGGRTGVRGCRRWYSCRRNSRRRGERDGWGMGMGFASFQYYLSFPFLLSSKLTFEQGDTNFERRARVNAADS